MRSKILAVTLSAALASAGMCACSTNSEANNSRGTTGSSTVLNTGATSGDRATLPAMPEDRELTVGDPARTTESDLTSNSATAPREPAPSPRQPAERDPYLPPRAHIPNGNAPATSEPTAVELSTLTTPSETKAARPSPSSPLPVLPSEGENPTTSATPVSSTIDSTPGAQGGGSASTTSSAQPPAVDSSTQNTTEPTESGANPAPMSSFNVFSVR